MTHETIRASGYLTIEPEWRGGELRGVSISRVTKNHPRGGRYAVGSAVVKLNIDLPRRVFVPFEASADVEASGEGDIGVVRVVLEPLTPQEGDDDV